MRWLAIANPTAGRAGATRRLVSRLSRVNGSRHDIVHTTGPGDATRLAHEASAFDGIVAIGGDGTVGEVLRGMDRARQRLAVLPAGHGNCLARDLGVADATLAMRALDRAASRATDLLEVGVGFADGRERRLLCASTLAIGYVAEVVTLGRQRLAPLGRAAYAVAAVLVMPATFEARVSHGGVPGVARRYTGVVINNTAHLANFRGLPDASVHDGVLDVMEQGFAWPRQLLHNAAVLAGSRAFGPLRLGQAPSAAIELAEPQTLMADGELLHDVMRVCARCLPGAVHCVVGSA